MKNDKSYPEEMFEKRLAGYRAKKRTKLPSQVQSETGKRVNRLLDGSAQRFDFSDDFSMENLCSETGVQQKLPFDLFEPCIHYDEMTGHALIKGRGGTVILDERVSMLDAVRLFIEYLQSRSCGQCTFCRVGSQRMMETVNHLSNGHCTSDNIEALSDLAEQIKSASLCEVGKLAAKPVHSLQRFLRSKQEKPK
jgi:NADH:ubiquinone oxidoreductase subunit F (NADH-binding)